jgi:hypothetical protein
VATCASVCTAVCVLGAVRRVTDIYQDQETRLLKRPISPRRLREGGAAILQALDKNHHIAILGIKLIKPLLTKTLCLPNRS